MHSAAALTLGTLLAAAQPEVVKPTEELSNREVHFLAVAGTKLTAEQASALQDALDRDPGDLAARLQLMAYHRYQRSLAGRDACARHALWIVRNLPGSEAAGISEMRVTQRLSPEPYAEARDAWLTQIEAHPEDAAVLGNAAKFFTIDDRARAIELVTRAGALQPDNPEWPKRLGQIHKLDAVGPRGVDPAAAKRSLRANEDALADLPEMKPARLSVLVSAARMALHAGELGKASKYATEALSGAEVAKGPVDGEAVHHGNLVLGHLALRKGDLEGAERHLLEAGKTPGSPALHSYGPNMMLAKDLLEAGRRQSVIEYLRACASFWSKEQADAWIKVIQDGGMPDFGANLVY